MRRTLFCLFLIATWGAGEAPAQYIGPGSTAPGDYLRGVGIELMGAGIYNWNTAVAESIQADTSIRVDQYVGEVLRQGRARYGALQRAARDRFDANYAAIRKRIAEHPEAHDVAKGDALNSLLDQLNNPQISESAFRLSPAKLGIEDIRKITFRLPDKGVGFSMQQLTVHGKGKWPVAFQDPRYVLDCKAYETALDVALEHMVNRDMPDHIIREYQQTIWALRTKVGAEPWAAGDPLRTEANLYLKTLDDTVNLLKLHQFHNALAELDNYGGTTVNDLRKFMKRHNLRFGQAESPDQRDLYPRLYELLVAVRESVLDRGRDRDK